MFDRLRTYLSSGPLEPKPEAAFDRAIEAQRKHYAALKPQVARLLFHRTKLEADVAERRAEVARVYDQACRAAERGDDVSALELIEHKRVLQASLSEADEQLDASRKDCHRAKQALLRASETIGSLEREKRDSRATVAAIGARRRLQQIAAHDPAEEQALERARDHAAKVSAEYAIERQIDAELDGPWGDPVLHGDDARGELQRLKLRRLGSTSTAA